MTKKISYAQQKALEFVSDYSKNRNEEAILSIKNILKLSNIDIKEYNFAIKNLKNHSRVCFHFHPDRPLENGFTVVESLLESGVYKNQFETLISNGSVSAYDGGDRDLWEQNLFGGAYSFKNSDIKDRPKYGSLNIFFHGDGSSIRFGSCYFLLKPELSKYATFTYMDSHQNPDERGTLSEFNDILSALMNEITYRDYALGEKEYSISKFIKYLSDEIHSAFYDPTKKNNYRNLNHYIEAQVHCDISLEDDIDYLVIDPSFKETKIEKIIKELCIKYNIKLFYHKGFNLDVNNVPSDFRGSSMSSLAKRTLEFSKNKNENFVDAYKIGSAVNDLKFNTDKWLDRGSYNEVLQELKFLWHVLVKFG